MRYREHSDTIFVKIDTSPPHIVFPTWENISCILPNFGNYEMYFQHFGIIQIIFPNFQNTRYIFQIIKNMIWQDHNFKFGPHIWPSYLAPLPPMSPNMGHNWNYNVFYQKFPCHIFEAIKIGQKPPNLRQLLMCNKSAQML